MDPEWKRYFRELERYERLNGVYGRMIRPSPPSPVFDREDARPSASRLREARAIRVGIVVRNAAELRRQFCDWRRVDRGRVTRLRFADYLGVSDRTVGRYCSDYELPWMVLKRSTCPPD